MVLNIKLTAKDPQGPRLCGGILNEMTGSGNPHINPILDLSSLFESSPLRLRTRESFLVPFLSLRSTGESMFPKIQHRKISDIARICTDFKYGQFVQLLLVVTIVPLLVNLISTDVYSALQQHTSVLMRLVLIILVLIVCCVFNQFFIVVHFSNPKDTACLLPLLEQLPEVLDTGSPNLQVRGRPYSPAIDCQALNMTDCYVNERWGVEFPEYITVTIHTNQPVPDVEAVLLSRLTLSGSKILIRRFEIGPQTGNYELDNLSSQITESMRRAREIDEDCTLQLGSFAVLKYRGEGLKWWRLQKEWTPTISYISRSSWNLWDFLTGKRAMWTIRGFHLQKATLKASTVDESEKLNILQHYKMENGDDVLLCEEPHVVQHAAPMFRKEVYLCASNCVDIEEGVAVDLQSEPKNVSRSYWISVVRGWTPRPWIMMTMIMMANLSFMPTHGLFSKPASYDLDLPNDNIFILGINYDADSIIYHILSWGYNFSLIYVAFILISVFLLTLSLQLSREQSRPSGGDVPTRGTTPHLEANRPGYGSPSSVQVSLLEDQTYGPTSITSTVVDESSVENLVSFQDEGDENPHSPQPTGPTEDFNSNPTSPLHKEPEMMKTDVNFEEQEEEEGHGVLGNASTSTSMDSHSFRATPPVVADYESIEQKENFEAHENDESEHVNHPRRPPESGGAETVTRHNAATPSSSLEEISSTGKSMQNSSSEEDGSGSSKSSSSTSSSSSMSSDSTSELEEGSPVTSTVDATQTIPTTTPGSSSVEEEVSVGSPKAEVQPLPQQGSQTQREGCHLNALIPGIDDQCPSNASVSVCGRRREMEDAVASIPSFLSIPCDTAQCNSRMPCLSCFHFFGVYDGHGGSQAALYCADRLHHLLAEEVTAVMRNASPIPDPDRDLKWKEAMLTCFLRMDAEVGGVCWRGGGQCGKPEGSVNKGYTDPMVPETVGTTAVVAVVSSCQLIIANCGDSRAVLSRGGHAVPLSNDHKPDREDEMARIEAAGGRVIFWSGFRVLGVLAMSRAIGDRYLKPFVIADPEVTCTQRTEKDECLILASDGLWDVLSNEVVCEIARKCLAGHRRSKVIPDLSASSPSSEVTGESPAAVAAALLTQLALARGSSDNISVVVVDLMNLPRR